MDVFWKGYFTFFDLEDRWGKTREEISAVVMSGKLVPSYFLESRDARDVAFVRDDENGEQYVVDETFPSEYISGKFAFLRFPDRVTLSEYRFYFACESPTAPMDEVPFYQWFSFDEPIRSQNGKIVFLRSQVEKFEKTYMSSTATPEPSRPSLYPWGDHNTRLLTKLSDAAIALWSRYDPLDPSTAPTNEQVQDWLITRNVPKRIAETMATMLRADGLKMGRRKY